MSDKHLPNLKHTPPDNGQQEPVDETVGGSVTKGEKKQIVDVLAQYGWNQSRGVRAVMTAFVESAAVRDTVFAHIHAKAAA
jgi:hypothetical protein